MRCLDLRPSGAALAAVLLFAAPGASDGELPEPCPADMVPVPGRKACIDRYEWPGRAGEKPLVGASALPNQEDVARGEVWDAEALCKSVGKRLPTAKEWIAACEGPGGTPYPWGETLPKFIPGDGTGLCNYDKHGLAFDEAKIARRDPIEMKRLNQSEPAGARSTCRSPSGAMDMVGSVEEWSKCDKGIEHYCLMGRFWSQPRPCRAKVTSHSPRWFFYQSGFRCAKDRP